ncbi:HlyD family secretion protein [Allorhizobium sp. BGMRC 0089]|uniref:HlyD family secretion protein n=1 Tax=Allorhizobium sonneratiae TaxID=2934936 RepID=UPI0020336E1F|nr:HlyD family secretion protein [Allorhizobium sonneratiae]MCM2290788.1 HlyD family secretion protein [Allorhizobium sonneratiae]
MSISSRKGAVRPVDFSEDEDDAQQAAAHDSKNEAGASGIESEGKRAEGAASSSPTLIRADAKPAKKRRSPILPVLGLAVLVGAGWFGYDWWTVGRFMVSTDDAYVSGDIAVISPKVSGYVATVNVKHNQRVKAGDVLVTLDQGDYQIALDQAKSQVTSARLTAKRIEAQILGGEAALDQAKAQAQSAAATLRTAELTYKRTSDLQSQSFSSTASLDSATSALDTARANVAAASAAIESANANIEVLKAQKAEAEAAIQTAQIAVRKAERDLGFTVLRAPYDGVIGNLGVQVGDLVSSASRLASLVPVNNLYIDANFKETQLARLVPGAKATISVDAFDGHPIEGTVVSIAPASGSVFSMLPPENATGNFTKIIQRVPVRIAIPADALASGRFRAGLSVVVDVDTRTDPVQKAPDHADAN